MSFPDERTQIVTAQLVKAMQDNFPALTELHQLHCRLMMVRFTELRKAGFNTEQALVLCKL